MPQLLTARQRTFVQRLLKTGSKVSAARSAGILGKNTAYNRGCIWARLPHIKRLIHLAEKKWIEKIAIESAKSFLGELMTCKPARARRLLKLLETRLMRVMDSGRADHNG